MLSLWAGHATNITIRKASPKRGDNWINGFRRADARYAEGPHENGPVTPSMPTSAIEGRHYNVNVASAKSAYVDLARKLRARHLQMIAIGSTIGGSRSKSHNEES